MADITDLYDPAMKTLEIEDGALSDLSTSLSPPSLDSEGFSDTTPDSTLQTPPPKPSSGGRKRVPPKRTVFSRKQLTAMENRFYQQSFLSREERKEFAAELGITERQVMIWFQNRRGRLKKRGPSDKAYNPCKLDELNARRPYPLLYGMISSYNYQNPSVCQQIMSMYPESIQQTAQSALGPTHTPGDPLMWQQRQRAGHPQAPGTSDASTIARLLSYQQKPPSPPVPQSQIYQRYSSDPQRLQQCLSATQNTGLLERGPLSENQNLPQKPPSPENQWGLKGTGGVTSCQYPSVGLVQKEEVSTSMAKSDVSSESDGENESPSQSPVTQLTLEIPQLSQQHGNQLKQQLPKNTQPVQATQPILDVAEQQVPQHQPYNQQYQYQNTVKPPHQYSIGAGDRNNNPSAGYSMYGGYDYSHLMSAAQVTEGNYGTNANWQGYNGYQGQSYQQMLHSNQYGLNNQHNNAVPVNYS